ncbi:hypothetical protein [Endozoicomonas sp. ISHI1]|uniref:hypothetical protein n=1 Tax=Endozoicomonas sp. ISHI1 TaxID=2825882 RepID=UPI002148E7FE|nr:hypothetical protein [Endozoicomonas sp. ISHI1]
MTTLATLTVDLLAESAQFRSELKKANKSAEDWSKKVRASAATAAKSMVAVGAAAATGLAVMYKNTAESIDQQTKFADKIGISTEALAGLQYAGELTGVSTEKLNMGLQRMTRRVAEAAQGTGEAVGALDELGLSAEAMAEMSPDQQFQAIAAAMGEVESQSDKVRLAFKLFDSEGVGLLNTLDAGVDGLQAMQDEAENFGIALSRVDAAKIEQANDAFYKTSLTTKGFTQALTAELAPIIQGISEELVNASNAAGGFGEVATEVVNSLMKGFGFVGDVIRGWEFIFEGLALTWKEAVYAIVYDITYLDQTVTDLINKLPGVNAEYNQTLQTMTQELGAEIENARNDYIDLVSKPLPSDQLEVYVHKWRELAQVQAEAKAAAVAPALPPADIVAATSASNAPAFSDKETERMEAELQRLQESLMTEAELIDLHEQQKLEKLQQWRDADVVNLQDYQNLKTSIVGKAEEDRQLLLAQSLSVQLQNSGKLFGELADLSKTFAGEQSGIYQAMFAVSKAFAIADSIVKIQTGIANAAALPFPANIPAMATVAAQTASIVTTISGTEMQGMAHDGIDYIPKEGTWLLDKGERVVDSRTNADLKAYLDQNNKSGMDSGSSDVNWSIQINEAPQGTTATVDPVAQVVSIAVGQSRQALLTDLKNGGEVRRTLEGIYPLNPGSRL